MLRRSLLAVLFVVALTALADDSQAAGHSHRGGVANYLFGGYGPGPFGHGDFTYAGWTSRTVVRHGELVPSFTTGMPRRTGR